MKYVRVWFSESRWQDTVHLKYSRIHNGWRKGMQMLSFILISDVVG